MQKPVSPITIEIMIMAPLNEVWSCWTEPQHIKRWNIPSNEWETTHAGNDVRQGGKFLFVMKAKDGSEGFDFAGVYDEVIKHREISYTLTDGRRTTSFFTETEEGTKLTEIFEPESGLDTDMQEEFCAGVLNNFKTYIEAGRYSE